MKILASKSRGTAPLDEPEVGGKGHIHRHISISGSEGYWMKLTESRLSTLLLSFHLYH